MSYGRLTSYGVLRLRGLPGQVAGRRDAGSPEPRTCPELSWRVQQGWGLEPQWLRRMTPGPSLPHAASASVVSLTPTPGAEGVQWPWEKFYHHSHQTESVWCGLVGKLFPGPCLHTSAPPAHPVYLHRHIPSLPPQRYNVGGGARWRSDQDSKSFEMATRTRRAFEAHIYIYIFLGRCIYVCSRSHT